MRADLGIHDARARAAINLLYADDVFKNPPQLRDSAINELFTRHQDEIPGDPCPNGCGEQVARVEGSMAEHLERCPLEMVQCPYAGCEETMFRCDLDAHVKKAVSYHLHHERLCHAEEVRTK